MVVNKRAKNTRQRGSQTHGWGAKKKHRGKGHKGGAGNSGTGKRADSKKPSIWKDEKYFGKWGFKCHNKSPILKTINLGDIERNLDKYLAAGLILKEKDFYVVDIEKLGYGKLLGSGKITKKYKIKAQVYSSNVSEKVTSVGGELITEENSNKE